MAFVYDSAKIIAEINSLRPRMILEVNESRMESLRYIQDSNGEYFWQPDQKLKTPGKFFGMEINLVKELESSRIRMIYFDGQEKIFWLKNV